MVAGSLPTSFASAKKSNISHVVHRNELEAQSVRFAALETDALRVRERMSAKYAYVSPRVTPPQAPSTGNTKYRTISPRMLLKASPRDGEIDAAVGTSPEASGGALVAVDEAAVATVAPLTKTKEEEDEDIAIAAQLVMPQQQTTGQLLCPGGESRNVDRHQEQTVLSSWDKLSIPRRVLEAHDLFVVTAGRVKPYATQTQSPRRPGKATGATPLSSPRSSDHSGPSVGSSGPNNTNDLNGSSRGLRKGLSHLKCSSDVEICIASVSADAPTRWSPRAASPRSKPPKKASSSPVKKAPHQQAAKSPKALQVEHNTSAEDLPELHQAPGDALAAGDEPDSPSK